MRQLAAAFLLRELARGVQQPRLFPFGKQDERVAAAKLAVEKAAASCRTLKLRRHALRVINRVCV